MIKYKTIIPHTILFGTIIAGITFAYSYNTTNTVKLIRVVDGDTVIINDKGTIKDIRIVGIDTPETVKPNAPVGCYGPEASQKTKDLMSSAKSIDVVEDTAKKQKIDPYKRILAHILIDGVDISEILVKGGYAKVNGYGEKFDNENKLLILQNDAQIMGRGIWSDQCKITLKK